MTSEIEADVVAVDDGDGENTGGIVAGLGELGDGAVIFEVGLAKLFGRCQTSIRRAVERGELPRPVRLLGAPSWTAGSIRRHLEARLTAAEREAARTAERVSRLKP